jgi:hypothetical protein
MPSPMKIMRTGAGADGSVAHNHISHSLLTRYALGGSPKLIEDTLEYDAGRHVSLDPGVGDRKVDQSHMPKRITRENWTDGRYLGQKE